MHWRVLAIIVILLAVFRIGPGGPGAKVVSASGQQMGYGMLANDVGAVARTGFNWVKLLASWRDLEPSANYYSSSAFGNLASRISSARANGLQVLLNVAHSPSWATGSASDTMPPADDNSLGDFMAYLSTYFAGQVGAYEIWNEPNLSGEWGNLPPSTTAYPVKFAAMLRALYPRVKAADPAAMVVVGGLSTTGDGIGTASYGDLLWIKDLYVEGNVRSCSDGGGGLRSCFDAIGSHPYGGPYAPETDPSIAQYDVGLYFRRAEQQKQMMDVWGQDYSSGIFATEFNWLLNPNAFGVSCSWGGPWNRYWLAGTADQQEATQADFLVRAFNYAHASWPWMRGMIVFNLDYQTGRDICDPVTWFAITRPDGSHRAAYNALANMVKPGVPPPVLQVSPQYALFLMDATGPNTDSRTFSITNSGSGALTWSAASSAAWLRATAVSPNELTVTVDRTVAGNGTFNGTVMVTGGPGTLNSPQTISLKMVVGTVYRSSPLAVRRGAP